VGEPGCSSQANGLWVSKDMTETTSQTRLIGYARVSTYGQALDAQLDLLCAEGCAKVYRVGAACAATWTTAPSRELRGYSA
jgi:hypothetical protein